MISQSQTMLIAALTLLSFMISTPTLLGAMLPGPLPLRNLITTTASSSQFNGSSYHCIFWPTKSDQRALQGCWCSLTNLCFFSPSPLDLPRVSEQILKDKSTLAFQSSKTFESLPLENTREGLAF